MADTRLAQHVEKGNEDGLFISSVATSSNLWALIMDAGTGFNAQVYELSQCFLHKEWIMKQWEKKQLHKCDCRDQIWEANQQFCMPLV